MALLIRTSLRHHLSRPSRLLLTVAGIASAVALLFSTALLNSTLRASIEDSETGTSGSADFEVTNPIAGGVDPGLWRALKEARGVAAVVPVARTTARIERPSGPERVVVLGVPRSFRRLFPGALGQVAGEIKRPRLTAGLLGPSLAGEYPPAARIELETPRGTRRVGPVEPAPVLPFADLNAGSFILTTYRTAANLFDRDNGADVVYVVGEPGVRRSALHSALSSAIGHGAVLSPPAEKAGAYRQTFDSLAQLSEIGSLVALWVALFAVFNAMSMSLTERRRVVALLRALGATRGQLLAVFLAEAAALGATGAVLGMCAGYFIAEGLLEHALASYPFLPLATTGQLQVTASQVVTTACVGVLVALLGAFVPIRNTLRASPLEGLSPDSAYEWGRYRRERRPNRIVAGLAVAGLGAILCVYVAAPELLPASGQEAAVFLSLVLVAMVVLLRPALTASLQVVERLLRHTLGAFGSLVMAALTKNRGRVAHTLSILTISLSLAIALGVALSSYESTMAAVFASRYGPPLYVTAASFSGVSADQPLPASVISEVRGVRGVGAAYPERHLPLQLDGRQAILVSGPMVREAEAGFSNAVANTRGEGRARLLAGLEHGGIVLSAYAASLNHLELGDRLSVPGVPVDWNPKVVGIYDDVLSIETMYIERSTYLRVSSDTSVDRIAVSPARNESPEALARRLGAFLDHHHVPAVVESRQTLIGSVLSNVRGAFAIAWAIQLAALLIASLIVAGTMLTTVNERRREFALYHALGMSRRRLRGSVMVEALVLGALGSAAALAAGLVIGLLMLKIMDARFLWAIPYLPSLDRLVAALAAGIVAVLAAALLPAKLAGRITAPSPDAEAP